MRQRGLVSPQAKCLLARARNARSVSMQAAAALLIQETWCAHACVCVCVAKCLLSLRMFCDILCMHRLQEALCLTLNRLTSADLSQLLSATAALPQVAECAP